MKNKMNDIGHNTKLHISKHIEIEERADHYVLTHKAYNTKFKINETGYDILMNFIEKNTSINELRRKYLEKFDDIYPFLIFLIRYHIIIPVRASEMDIVDNEPLVDTVSFDLTYRCNLNCSICFQKDLKKLPYKELKTKQIYQIIDELHAYGVKKINFSGGEPFVRHDFIDILSYASNMGFYLSVLTNGTLINKDVVKKLVDLQMPISFQISLDGAKPETHNNIRGPGTFQRTINAIELLRKNGFDVVVASVFSKKNINELEPMINLLEKLDVTTFRPGVVLPLGNALDNFREEDYIPSYVILEKVIGWKKNNSSSKLDIVVPVINANDHRVRGCDAIYESFLIDPWGNVLPCNMFNIAKKRLIFGNLLKESLQEIWFKEEYVKFRNITVNDIEECSTCPYKYLCGGGCRARAYIKYGNLYKKDPLCFNIKKSIEWQLANSEKIKYLNSNNDIKEVKT